MFGATDPLFKETRMDRAGKSESIEALKGVFHDAGAVVVTHYTGLTVAEMTDLRHRLRAQGASLKVVKNRLAQKALNGAGEGAYELFKGPVAIAYGPDAVSAAEVARSSPRRTVSTSGADPSPLPSTASRNTPKRWPISASPLGSLLNARCELSPLSKKLASDR